MKHRFFLPILTSVVLLTGMEANTVASAQINKREPVQTNAVSIEVADDFPLEADVDNPQIDPAAEEQRLREEFRGINLTLQQFERVRQARRLFHSELQKAASQNFGLLLFQFAFSSQVEASQRAREVLGNPIANYVNALAEILTPEQLRIWRQNSATGV